MPFHVFNALLCLPLCIIRCPAFENTFNHSHEFVQLSLALTPAMFTNTSHKLTISLVKQGKFKVGAVPVDGLGRLLLKTIFCIFLNGVI
jgi:hypothetical protein